MKTNTLATKTLGAIALFALAVSSFGFSGYGAKVAQAAANWDVDGEFVIQMNYNGTDYPHSVSLSQDSEGNLTGDGSSGAYTWEITSGSMVDGDSISINANYTATADAVTPLTVLELDGTINEDGSMSGTWNDNYQGGERVGTWTAEAGSAQEIVENANVTTDAATNISSTEATLNGTNGGNAAIGHSFWVSTSTFSTASPSLPGGVYSTPDLGAIAADTSFSASLSSVTGLPAITAGTTYYVAAWSNVGGTWYPGEVLSFTTSATDEDPETSTVTILKYVDAALATGTSANNTDFTMNASWNSENLGGAGSGQFALSENGFNGGPAYQATTSEMTNGASYSVSEAMDANTGLACSENKPYALKGYTSGNSIAAAMAATPSMTAPNLTNITSDQYIIVWNDDCATEGNDGTIGGEVVGGEGILEVTGIDVIDSTASADGTFENGWEYVFHITVPTDETDLSMKFSDWVKTGDAGEIIPAANNIRISSAQADTDSTVMISGADVYSSPVLNINEDLDAGEDGMQVEVRVEVRVPSGTENGSYTTNYGVLSN